jgi:hypothetical protein
VSFRAEGESRRDERGAQASTGQAPTGTQRGRWRPSRVSPLLLVRGLGGDVEVEAPQGDVTVGNVNTDTGGADLEAGEVTLSGGGRVSVQTGDMIAWLPPEDARDLILQTRVGSVLRKPTNEDSNGQGSKKQKQQGS